MKTLAYLATLTGYAALLWRILGKPKPRRYKDPSKRNRERRTVHRLRAWQEDSEFAGW